MAWQELLCDPSGWEAPEDWRLRVQLATATKYSTAYGKAGMKMAVNFTPLPNPPGGKCDVCSTPCTSECAICGELYCSRICLRSAWTAKGGGHRKVCEVVFENGELAVTASQIEMDNMGGITPEELSVASGATEKARDSYTTTSEPSKAEKSLTDAQLEAKKKRRRKKNAARREREKAAGASSMITPI